MLCDKKKCTGCFTCYNICPKKAIIMKEDKYGNVYPHIDKDKCINCKLCEKFCPELKDYLVLNEPIETYAMHLKSNKLRSESTSGGAASAFSLKMLDDNGVVYGASNLFGRTEFGFIRIDNKNNLYMIKGSKYLHCYVNDSFKNVKNDLNNNKKVLFIATPCQIAGLKSYLNKEYENLITIDIICHGVSSQKLFFEQLHAFNIKYNEVCFVSFRDKKNFNFKLYDFNRKVLIEKKASEVPYYKNFLQGNTYRDNCYSCKYAQHRRVADITIGDFWGLDKESIVFDDESMGISCIIVNTSKGMKYINKIFDISVIEKRDIEEVRKNNMQLNHPMKKGIKYKIFKKIYPIFGFKLTMKILLFKK